MGANPKDALDSATAIATNAIEKSGEIVESAADVLRGDVSGGVGRIVESAKDIVTGSVEGAKDLLTGKDDSAAE